MSTEDYLLKVYRYIELNPVRAGVVEHALEYPWPGYQGNAVVKTIKMLTPHRVYQQLAKTVEQPQSVYRSLFRGRMAEWEVIINDSDPIDFPLISQREVERRRKPKPNGSRVWHRGRSGVCEGWAWIGS
ncbi:hypothetical protein SAMN02745866_01959 [Alteromonadaceae bacterium Bs31]|nr:hypothetical protein SAMN02745866_01959 [Alteromonadaceae bacterium Bs31]